MKVLVTGSDGYIGSVLVPVLRARGHAVTGLDTGFYLDGLLYAAEDAGGATSGEGAPRSDGAPRGDASASLRRDIRQVTREELAGYEAVVHLAELSNDPLSQHDERTTYAINHQGSVRLARLSKAAGVERFVYTSSCSVYGVQNGEAYKTEASPVAPQTAYARCKVLVERDVGALASEAFSPTFLRNATAYGPSPRMRFDIVLNNLSGHAWTTGEIRMTSDGSPWRPLVHVRDICEAIACTLEAPRERVHGEVFNVGSTEENYQVREIAAAVAEVFGGGLSLGRSDGDTRSYRVAFDKIAEGLPGYRGARRMRAGAEELREVYERIGMTPEVFGYRAFTRLRQLKHLLESGQLDAQLYWRAA